MGINKYTASQKTPHKFCYNSIKNIDRFSTFFSCCTQQPAGDFEKGLIKYPTLPQAPHYATLCNLILTPKNALCVGAAKISFFCII